MIDKIAWANDSDPDAALFAAPPPEVVGFSPESAGGFESLIAHPPQLTQDAATAFLVAARTIAPMSARILQYLDPFLTLVSVYVSNPSPLGESHDNPTFPIAKH
jgi:hypothetical protein